MECPKPVNFFFRKKKFNRDARAYWRDNTEKSNEKYSCLRSCLVHSVHSSIPLKIENIDRVDRSVNERISFEFFEGGGGGCFCVVFMWFTLHACALKLAVASQAVVCTLRLHVDAVCFVIDDDDAEDKAISLQLFNQRWRPATGAEEKWKCCVSWFGLFETFQLFVGHRPKKPASRKQKRRRKYLYRPVYTEPVYMAVIAIVWLSRTFQNNKKKYYNYGKGCNYLLTIYGIRWYVSYVRWFGDGIDCARSIQPVKFYIQYEESIAFEFAYFIWSQNRAETQIIDLVLSFPLRPFKGPCKSNSGPSVLLLELALAFVKHERNE